MDKVKEFPNNQPKIQNEEKEEQALRREAEVKDILEKVMNTETQVKPKRVMKKGKKTTNDIQKLMLMMNKNFTHMNKKLDRNNETNKEKLEEMGFVQAESTPCLFISPTIICLNYTSFSLSRINIDHYHPIHIIITTFPPFNQ